MLLLKTWLPSVYFINSEAYTGSRISIYVAKQNGKGWKLESSFSLVEETKWQKKKTNACLISDKVESLKHSFTVIHLWQKMWAIILGVRSKPKYQVSILCEQNTCAGEHLLASAQMQLPKPCSSGWIQNNTSSPSLFVFYLKPRQRIFNSRERAWVGFALIFFC